MWAAPIKKLIKSSQPMSNSDYSTLTCFELLVPQVLTIRQRMVSTCKQLKTIPNPQTLLQDDNVHPDRADQRLPPEFGGKQDEMA